MKSNAAGLNSRLNRDPVASLCRTGDRYSCTAVPASNDLSLRRVPATPRTDRPRNCALKRKREANGLKKSGNHRDSAIQIPHHGSGKKAADSVPLRIGPNECPHHRITHRNVGKQVLDKKANATQAIKCLDCPKIDHRLPPIGATIRRHFLAVRSLTDYSPDIPSQKAPKQLCAFFWLPDHICHAVFDCGYFVAR